MENKEKFRPDPQLRLMDQVRQVMRYHHYAYRTEKTYCDWIVRYIKFHGSKKHPRDMAKNEIEAFLSHLATRENVAASTQRQALNAIVFLYHSVLDIKIDGLIEPVKAKRHRSPPVVMTKSEVQRVLSQVQGVHLLMTRLLYGSGLRLMECIRLRIQDLDFERNRLYVRSGKGGKDRLTLLPKSVQVDLQVHVDRVKHLHDEDLSHGCGEVYLPDALEKKYRHAAREFRWQYVFPSKKLSRDPRTDTVRRHHAFIGELRCGFAASGKLIYVPFHNLQYFTGAHVAHVTPSP